MPSQTTVGQAEQVTIAKRDAFETWAVLERLVVSLRKMGSYYSVPQKGDQLSPERHTEMLEELDRLLDPETCKRLSHARRVLSDALPSDELEQASEESIDYWRPTVALEKTAQASIK